MLSRLRGSATSDDDKQEKPEPPKKTHNRAHPRDRLSRDRSRESDRSSLGLTRLYLPQRDHSTERNHMYQIHDRSRDGAERGHTRERSRREKSSHRSRPHATVEREKVDMPKEYLERQVEELKRQLQDEKQHNRRDKLTVARLQRELARTKSEGPVRESLMRDLEREKMLRVDAEHRLHDMTIDSDNCKSRLQALQQDFKKMEEMVRGMMQYKGKIDILKQEKSNLTVTYETSMKKYHSHISNLEHENKLLLAEIKKLEGQPNNRTDEADKSRLLLERLKRLESENSGLVLENEQQRQQYEKCLDDIANQVVQALITQKSLREECMKLQKRVRDLEQQNRELNAMFQQRMRFTSDSFLQSLTNRKLQHSHSTGETRHTSSDGTGSFHSLPTTSQPQTWFQPARSQFCQNKLSPRPATGASEMAYLEDSFESLQSMFSDCNDNAQFDDSLGKPQLSSPPPWLRDKLFQATSSQASEDGSLGAESQLLIPQENVPASASYEKVPSNASCEKVPSSANCENASTQQTSSSKSVTITTNTATDISSSQLQTQSKIETEFPASNTSPKMTYSIRNTALPCERLRLSCDTASAQESCDSMLPPGGSEGKSLSNEDGHLDAAECVHEAAAQLAKPRLESVLKTNYGKESNKCDVSPGRELLKLSDSFNEKFIVNDGNGLPVIQNKFPDSEDDDDESISSPRSKHISIASTVSLNELLERGLDDMETPVDDNFEIDNLPFFQTQDSKLNYLAQGVDSSASESELEETSPNRIKLVISALPKEMCLNICAQNDHTSTSAPRNNEAVLNNSNANNNNSSCSLYSTPKPSLQRPNSLDVVSPDDTKKCNSCVTNEEGTPTPTNSHRSNSVTATNENLYSNNQAAGEPASALPKSTASPCSSTSCPNNSKSSNSHERPTSATSLQSLPSPNDDIFPLFKKPLPPKLPPRRAPPKPPKPPALPPKNSHRSLERQDSFSTNGSLQNVVLGDCGPPPPLPPRNNEHNSNNVNKNRKFLSSLSDVPPPPPPRPHRQKECSKVDHPLKNCLPQEQADTVGGKVTADGSQKEGVLAASDSCTAESSNERSSTEEMAAEKSKPMSCENGPSNSNKPMPCENGPSNSNKPVPCANGTSDSNKPMPYENGQSNSNKPVPCENGPSNLSPDSAMQQSFSSTCSNSSDILSDTKPISSSRDDGYSSLSSDVQPEVMEKFAFIKKIPKLGHHTAGARCGVIVNGACENGGVCGTILDERKRHDSDSSNSSNSSIESFTAAKVKDIRAFFEAGKTVQGESKHHTLPKSKPCMIKYVCESDCAIQNQVSMQVHNKGLVGQAQQKTQENSTRSYDSLFSTRFFDIKKLQTKRLSQEQTDLSSTEDNIMASSSETTVPYNHLSDTCLISPRKSSKHNHIKAVSCGSHKNKSHARVCVNCDGSAILPRSVSEGYINNLLSDSDDEVLSTASTPRGQHHKHGRRDCVKLVRRRRIPARDSTSPQKSASSQSTSQIDKRKSGVSNNVSCQRRSAKTPDAAGKVNDMNTFLSSDTDSDLEETVGVNFLELWKQRESPAMKLPEWNPKLTASELKKNQFPSPLSGGKLDTSTSSEQWLLNFSKTDITQQLNKSTTSNPPSKAQTLPMCTPRHPHSPARQIPRTNINITNHRNNSSFRVDQNGASCKIDEKSSLGKPVNQNRKPVNHNGGAYQCPRSPFMGMSSVHRRRASEGDYKVMNAENQHRQVVSGKRVDVLSSSGIPRRVNTSPHHRRSGSTSAMIPADKNKQLHGCNTVASKNYSTEKNGGDFDLSRTLDSAQRSLTSLNSVFDDSVMTDTAVGNDRRCSQEYFTWLDESLEVPVAEASSDRDSNCYNCVKDGSMIASDMDDTIISVQSTGNLATRSPAQDHQGDKQRKREKIECSSGNHGNRGPVDADEYVLDAEKRADLLDSMVSGQGSDQETFGLNGDIAAKVNARKGKQDALRHSISPRKTLDYSTFFKRFGEEEERAMSKFSFLDEFSSTTPSDDETHELNQDASSSKEVRNDNQATPSGENKENEQVDNVVVNGIIDFSGDMMRALRLNPIKNRALEALKEEVRTDNNRLSTATFDQLTFGEDGISLSDSCCESFSSSNMSVNDITIL